MNRLSGIIMLLVFGFCAASFAQRYIKEGHQTLVADHATVETLDTGFGFLEGPITDKAGNIYFTDIPKNNIHIWTIENELKTFRENSDGANGLAFLNDTTLIVCEGINRQLTEITLNGKVTVLVNKFEGKKLNSPNDVWIDPKGGIYFSDPRYGDRDNMELEGEYVFYLTPDRKKLIKVVDDLIRPNGLLGSPDGKLLYVADRSGDANFVYTINKDGTLSNKTFFSKEGSDGMTMDSEGNIYITSPKGEAPFHVSIYNSEGVKLEEIVTPEKPANVQFGGKDGKTLFITARTSLYAIKMRVGGMSRKELGPMVGYTTHTKSTIWYYAGQGRDVELRYGKKGMVNAELKKQRMPPRSQNNFTSLAELTGLVPATKYQYQVWVDGKKAGEGSFSTAPIPHQPVEFNYLFASCISLKVSKTQKAWDAILQEDYDFQMFHGDNVYANSTNHSVLWGHHMEQRSVANFAEVLTQAPTYATWDDHDFGPNNSDGSTPGKEESLRLFKDVWSNPSYGLPDAHGVFYTYMWGDVQYFVLDNRFHRTEKGTGPDNTQLGIKQRAWLLDGLKKSRAPFKVILSGGSIQRGGEKWAEFEVELKTIMNFIRDNKIYGVMFQGGDVHIVYFKKYDNNAQDEFHDQVRPALLQYETEMGYPVYDIISSGVAKHKKRPWSIVNVNTKLADPTMTIRFYEEEKFKEEHVLRLSDLMHVGVKDLLPNSPFDGQQLAVGSKHPIKWTTIGTVETVDLEYKADEKWISIATGVANSEAYEWTVPNTASPQVKIRIRDANGDVVGESQGHFEIIKFETNKR